VRRMLRQGFDGLVSTIKSAARLPKCRDERAGEISGTAQRRRLARGPGIRPTHKRMIGGHLSRPVLHGTTGQWSGDRSNVAIATLGAAGSLEMPPNLHSWRSHRPADWPISAARSGVGWSGFAVAGLPVTTLFSRAWSTAAFVLAHQRILRAKRLFCLETSRRAGVRAHAMHAPGGDSPPPRGSRIASAPRSPL
jgi:hypothetical protein